MKPPSTISELAERLAGQPSPAVVDELARVQVRLARVLARLWDGYAEMVELRGELLARAGKKATPVGPDTFRPGDTLKLGDLLVRTDPRLALLDRLNVDLWQQEIGRLGEAVLQAPNLARLDLAGLLSRSEGDLFDELLASLEERDTDEFPIVPNRRRKK